MDLEGKEVKLRTYCTAKGLPYKTIHMRLQTGWPMNEALTTPVLPNKRPRPSSTKRTKLDTSSTAQLEALEAAVRRMNGRS